MTGLCSSRAGRRGSFELAAASDSESESPGQDSGSEVTSTVITGSAGCTAHEPQPDAEVANLTRISPLARSSFPSFPHHTHPGPRRRLSQLEQFKLNTSSLNSWTHYQSESDALTLSVPAGQVPVIHKRSLMNP